MWKCGNWAAHGLSVTALYPMISDGWKPWRCCLVEHSGTRPIVNPVGPIVNPTLHTISTTSPYQHHQHYGSSLWYFFAYFVTEFIEILQFDLCKTVFSYNKRVSLMIIDIFIIESICLKHMISFTNLANFEWCGLTCFQGEELVIKQAHLGLS